MKKKKLMHQKNIKLTLIILLHAFWGIAQSEYQSIKFGKDYSYGEKPVIDSILINGDLIRFIQENAPALVGEQIVIRTVAVTCGNKEYFRVYDCIILRNNSFKSELIQLSDWLSEKELLVFFNPHITKTILERKTTKCSFTIEW